MKTITYDFYILGTNSYQNFLLSSFQIDIHLSQRDLNAIYSMNVLYPDDKMNVDSYINKILDYFISNIEDYFIDNIKIKDEWTVFNEIVINPITNYDLMDNFNYRQLVNYILDVRDSYSKSYFLQKDKRIVKIFYSYQLHPNFTFDYPQYEFIKERLSYSYINYKVNGDLQDYLFFGHTLVINRSLSGKDYNYFINIPKYLVMYHNSKAHLEVYMDGFIIFSTDMSIPLLDIKNTYFYSLPFTFEDYIEFKKKEFVIESNSLFKEKFLFPVRHSQRITKIYLNDPYLLREKIL